MNEQDKIIEEKIKKREKTDIMLAYVLIVILLACILLVVYFKFIKKRETIVEEPTEYTANYITLNTLSSNVGARLNTKYSGIISDYSDNDNNIGIKYGDIEYIVPLVNNELEFTINNDNKELSEDIYKEIVASICTYYHEDRDGCLNTSNGLNGTNISGVRFLNDKVYISITNNINPSDEVINNAEENTNTEKDNNVESNDNSEDNNLDEVQEVNETIE